MKMANACRASSGSPKDNAGEPYPPATAEPGRTVIVEAGTRVSHALLLLTGHLDCGFVLGEGAGRGVKGRERACRCHVINSGLHRHLHADENAMASGVDTSRMRRSCERL